MAFFGFFTILFCTFVLGVIRLANHFGLAMSPDDRHSGFGVANVTNFVREIGIQLNVVNTMLGAGQREIVDEIVFLAQEYANESVSIICLK